MNGDDTGRTDPTAPAQTQNSVATPPESEQQIAPEPQYAEPQDTADVLPEEEEAEPDLPAFEPITWLAPEFAAHEKNFKWYATLGGIAGVIAILMYVITRDAITSVTLVLVAAMLAYVGSRKPRDVTYQIDETALTVGTRVYPLERFKSFAILKEGNLHSVALYPFQRFKPLVTIYFTEADEAMVTELLAELYPLEEREHDLIDRALHKIKL